MFSPNYNIKNLPRIVKRTDLIWNVVIWDLTGSRDKEQTQFMTDRTDRWTDSSSNCNIYNPF